MRFSSILYLFHNRKVGFMKELSILRTTPHHWPWTSHAWLLQPLTHLEKAFQAAGNGSMGPQTLVATTSFSPVSWLQITIFVSSSQSPDQNIITHDRTTLGILVLL